MLGGYQRRLIETGQTCNLYLMDDYKMKGMMRPNEADERDQRQAE